MAIPKILNPESRPFKRLLLAIVIVVAIGIVQTDFNRVWQTLLQVNTEKYAGAAWQIILCAANFAVLLFFYFKMVSSPSMEFSEKSDPPYANGIDRYLALLDTLSNKNHPKKKAFWFQDRVNILVRQLNSNILLYMLFLMVVYPLYVVDHAGHVYHLEFKVLKDVFNYLSSIFVYLAFLVLYNETLDKKNRWGYYRNAYFWIVILITAVYCFTYYSYFPYVTEEASRRLSLFAGIINGLAMVLLFSRYISMDYVLKRIKTIRDHRQVELGIIYLLPAYAIVQPLFGTFEIEAFGNKVIFANLVFLFCLIGKIFFLYVTDFFMRRRVVHLFLHLSITPIDVPMFYEKCFKLRNQRVAKVERDEPAWVD